MAEQCNKLQIKIIEVNQVFYCLKILFKNYHVSSPFSGLGEGGLGHELILFLCHTQFSVDLRE